MGKNCSIVEDLLPLFEEDLLQPETKQWVEKHLATCDQCGDYMTSSSIQIPAEAIQPIKTANKMMKNVQLKLSIYQILFVALSFILAMSTNILSDSFAFVLTYFLLGFLTFLFYRNWLIALAISFIPIFVWAMVEPILSYGSYANYMAEQGEFGVLYLILGGLLVGIIHTIFTLLGSVVALLFQKVFEKE